MPISPKDEFTDANGPSVFNGLQTQNLSVNPEISVFALSATEATVSISIVPSFDPAAVIIQNRVGRPRKWASDAERKAYERAMKAKKPITVQELTADLDFDRPNRKVRPSLLKQRVQEQGNKCLLCERAFGTIVTNGERAEPLRPSPDQFEPWSLRKNNDDSNIFAVDQICNSMKRDVIFKSLNEARIWIKKKWNEDGWAEGFAFTPFRADLSRCNAN
jgi:hypothetical protein